MNTEELRKELIGKYKKLKAEANSYAEDIKATMEALEDYRIDYVTKKEFQNDLIYDQQKLTNITDEMHEIEAIALTERISLVDDIPVNTNDAETTHCKH